MNRFGFINHYLDTNLVHERFRILDLLHFSRSAIKNLIALLPPYRYMELRPVRSIFGVNAEGLGIACPLLPEHFVTLPPKVVLRKIVRAGKIAEDFGAKLVGLGGFTSVFGNEGEEVSKCLRIAVTSGNTYTAALAIQGVLAAAQAVGCRLEEASLAVIGATGDIGSICAKVLSRRVRRVLVSARDKSRLKNLSGELQKTSSAEVYITKYTTQAVKQADIVLTATSALTTLIEPNELRPGAIVCDVSYPANITRDVSAHRNDILVFEGGLATWPFYDDLKEVSKLRHFAPRGTIHGCLAETMLLALEGQFENFSIGRGLITEARIEQVLALAQKHGFRLAPFHCGTMFYGDDDFKRIRKVVEARKSRQEHVVAL